MGNDFLLIYTIGIPGEPEQNFVRCYSSPIDLPEMEHDVMLNIIRDAWIQRYTQQGKILKPFMDPFDFEKVAKVMDIDCTTVSEFLKLRGENNS